MVLPEWHRGVELSVSLTEEDAAVLDDHAGTAGPRSRSAALHHAIRLLRHPDPEEEYAAAWEEWAGVG
ncbi:Arc/MetJ-type ribon-helix-helix transcriptional regulator [Geodermatophilus bullaregiensis]|uniref:ribbon-helix-helix protein, CopG family n=1 Tax=Geodermatophilus bullaregiensis TaxID=1564160 RepID=UPI0027DD67FB|nr:ribbon-helix-helix protein, CopG family [Geodermatophilus bullaregiensis]MBM7805148.1 Arc/MetJ-type ribon-helix-helix transcriptional regulator [Geodermatophilus bullaregiensis]